MAERLYCIVDITVDEDAGLDGLLDMTSEEANAWLAENQTEDAKYKKMRHNWLDDDTIE
jgi:hypothetical protein